MFNIFFTYIKGYIQVKLQIFFNTTKSYLLFKVDYIFYIGRLSITWFNQNVLADKIFTKNEIFKVLGWVKIIDIVYSVLKSIFTNTYSRVGLENFSSEGAKLKF